MSFALGKIIEQQSFAEDPNFNLWEHAREDPIFQQHVREFIAVQSADEYNFVRAGVQSAIASRRTLENAGAGGWFASTLAAIASPTVLLPTGTVGAGVRASTAALRLGGQSAAAGGVGVAIQESILQGAPNDRAMEESMINIAFGTVLAGGLGAGIGAASRGLREGASIEKPVIPKDAEVYVPREAPSAVPTRAVQRDAVTGKVIGTEVPEEIESVAEILRDSDSGIIVGSELHEEGIEIRRSNDGSITYEGDIPLVESNAVMRRDVEGKIEEALIELSIGGQRVGRYTAGRFSFDEGITITGDAEIFGNLAHVEKQLETGFLDGSVGSAQVGEIEVEPINPTQTNEALIGAEGDIKLDSALGLESTIGKISPTVRGYTNPYSNTVRDMMRRLDSGGLLFRRADDERIVADPDVATRAKGWEGLYYKAKSRTGKLISDHHLASKTVGERLSVSDIMQQASDAIDGGLDNFEGPEVVREIARAYQEEIFIPFAEEAKRLGFTGHEHWRDPKTYVPHMAKRSMVASDHEEFVEVLTEYFAENLFEQTSQKISTLEARTARRLQEAEDISKTDEEVVALREDLERIEAEVNDGLKPESQRQLERAAEMRGQAQVTDDPVQKKALQERARELEQGNEELGRRHERLKGIRRRKTSLNKSGLAVREAIDKKETQIRTAESQNLRSINGLVVKARTMLDEMRAEAGGTIRVKDLNQFEEDVQALFTSIDDFAAKNPDYAALTRDATTREGKMQASTLVNEVSKVADVKDSATPARLRRDRGSLRGKITRGEKAGKNVDDLRQRETAMTKHIDDLEEDLRGIQDNLTTIEPFGRIGRDIDVGSLNRLNAKLLDLNEARTGIVNRRAIRVEKLRKQRDTLDPDAPLRKAEALRAKVDEQTRGLYAKLEEQGITFAGGKFDVSALSRKQAEVVAAKFSGEVGRIPLTSTLLERGSELERTLEIDPLRTWSNGRRFADFLERDLDVLSRLYTRTVGSDFEVYREFGSLSPYGRASDGVNKTGLLARLQDDFEKARAEAREKYKDDPKKLQRVQKKIGDSRRNAERDVQAVVDRIRHVRGIPEDPSGIPYRAGRALLNLNTLRLMGGVTISSLPDVFRLVMKQGLKSVYKDGFQTLFTNMGAIKGLRQEAKSFAVGLDLLTHGRLAAITDVFDDYVPGTKPERLLQYATNNMGRVALFDAWNAFWKQTSGVMSMQRAVRDIQTVLSGKGDVRSAENFLAHGGITDEMADRIWTQMTETPNGAQNYKGVLVPNTAEWTDPDAARAFGSAILRIVDDTIITPGTERPLLFDGSMTGRIMLQFRSFAFASLVKTMMQGAQELKYGNLNVPIGMALSVGMGMIGWYVWAQLAGEDAQKKVEKAGFDKWLDEGIARSGLLGPMQEALNIGEKIPWLQTSLSGDVSTKSYSPFRDPFIGAFGPTVGLLEDLQTIAGTADDPREATVNAATRLLPLHNLFYMRPLINAGKEKVSESLGR